MSAAAVATAHEMASAGVGSAAPVPSAALPSGPHPGANVGQPVSALVRLLAGAGNLAENAQMIRGVEDMSSKLQQILREKQKRIEYGAYPT
jgi:hypothetical protein